MSINNIIKHYSNTNIMKITEENFLEVLKEEMKKQEITPYRISKISGIPEGTLSQNLSGKTSMSASTFLKIKDILKIKL